MLGRYSTLTLRRISRRMAKSGDYTSLRRLFALFWVDECYGDFATIYSFQVEEGPP